ncbi:MAG: hypothetical protein OXB84_09035 [Halobacteriovoraceae bacterium]|nr:hypothetical protein [Halobacteriovoraceae bacterium]
MAENKNAGRLNAKKEKMMIKNSLNDKIILYFFKKARRIILN